MLIKDVDVDYILADRGYDSDAIRKTIKNLGAEAVIPSKKNRKVKQSCDFEIYRLRHLVENAFLKLKKWRGINTRYAKNTSSFKAAVQIRCLALWGGMS
jgi:transposase